MDVEYVKEVLKAETVSFMEYIGKNFCDKRGKEQALKYIGGLLSPIERKNGWQLAEARGDLTPYAVQQFLYRGRWDAEEVKNSARAYVKDQLGDAESILVVDETGFLKKGKKSAGVQRQYSGTAGRVENCQLGVFLTYASPHGFTVIDRELYLPKEWTDDRDRCRAAGIPDTVKFKTKPEMALSMLQCACEARMPFSWVTADSVYGDSRNISIWLENIQKGYVLAVSGKAYVWQGSEQHKVSTILKSLPKDGWQRLSCGSGSKGERYYDWFCVKLNKPPIHGWERFLLVRRSISDCELRAFICFCPKDTVLKKLVEVAGTRWTVEQSFEETKGQLGLDHYEVRSYQGWYKHITLVCCSHILLTVIKIHIQHDDAFEAAIEPEHLSDTLHPAIGLDNGKMVLVTESRESNSLAVFKKKRNL